MLPSNIAQLAKLKSRLDSLPGRINKAVSARLAPSGAALVSEMQRLCPSESGALRESIRLAPTEDAARVMVTVGGASAPYAQHVEFGTSKMHAEPFFFPAFRSMRGRIAADLKTAATGAVKGEGSK